MLKTYATALLALIASSALSDERFDSLYQPLIDRFPFGSPPPGYDAAGNWTGEGPEPSSAAAAADAQAEEIPLSEQQQALKKAVAVSLLSRDPLSSVMQVGFTDSSDPKSPRAHLVEVGSSEDGWLVKSVDEAKKSVVLVKNDIEIEVEVGSSSASAPSGKNEPSNPRRGSRSALIGARPQGNQESGMRSMRGMRRERELERQQQLAADRKEWEEQAARQKAELERQREVAEQEKAEREAERAAEREEYKARLNDLASQLEQKLAEKRREEAEGGQEE